PQQVVDQVQAHARVTPETPPQAQAAVGPAAEQEENLLCTMHAAGGHYVVGLHLPVIGLSRSAAAHGGAAAQGLSGLSRLYTGVLGAGSHQLSDQGLTVVPGNVYALFNEVVADPSAFGFSNVTDPACGAGATSVQCGPEGSGAPYTYAAGTDQSYLFA